MSNCNEKLNGEKTLSAERLNEKMSTSGDTLENLLSHLGDFGKYQLFQVILFFLASLTGGMHMFSLVPTAAVPEHRCIVPWLENDTILPWDSDEILSAIPKETDGSLSTCKIFEPGTNISRACNAWVYNTTYYTYTRAMQWDMVCDRSWMGALAQSFYMSGVFIGAIICGSIADKYGRKTVYCWSAVLQLIVGSGIAFINNYNIFIPCLFFYGFVGSGGAFVTAFVMTMELVSANKRTVIGVMYQGVFAVGVMLVSVWASITSHAVTLQFIIGAHSLLLIGQYWWMDESPRWLWSQGRISESVRIVAKGVKINGGSKFDTAYYISKGKAKTADEEPPSVGLSVLMSTPRLRAKSLNIVFAWGANSLAYYGLSLSTNKMDGNPFLNMFIMAMVELPSYAVCIPLIEKIGRRSLTCMLMLGGGAICLFTILLPQDWISVKAVIFFIGKFCVAGSSATIINYSAELFPTVARNTGIGLGQTCAGLGAMLTPAISLLDIFDRRLHIIVYSTFAMSSGFLMLFLPETLNQPLPQTLEDGETFGAGDTAFVNGCFPKKRRNDYILAKPV